MDEGPLAGKTLYAIVERLEDGSLRLDLEPGNPGSTGEEVRPPRFDAEDTAVLRRAGEE